MLSRPVLSSTAVLQGSLLLVLLVQARCCGQEMHCATQPQWSTSQSQLRSYIALLSRGHGGVTNGVYALQCHYPHCSEAQREASWCLRCNANPSLSRPVLESAPTLPTPEPASSHRCPLELNSTGPGRGLACSPLCCVPQRCRRNQDLW